MKQKPLSILYTLSPSRSPSLNHSLTHKTSDYVFKKLKFTFIDVPTDTRDDSRPARPYRVPTALMEEWRHRPRTPSIAGHFGQALGVPEKKADYSGFCFERQFPSKAPTEWDSDEQAENNVRDFLSFSITHVSEPISKEDFSDLLSAL